MTHENIAEVGDYIKAYVGDPSRDNPCYIIGRVIDKGEAFVEGLECDCYTVMVIRCSTEKFCEDKKGTIQYVMYKMPRDYEGRIVVMEYEDVYSQS